MVFRDSVFTEQYHLGRPESLRAGSCLGKHVPVIEYSAGAYAADFLTHHFEEIWNGSKDITAETIAKALSGNDGQAT